ncbi:MAG: hypothetical protein ACYCOU_00185 [Sulfobacillus sp.]
MEKLKMRQMRKHVEENLQHALTFLRMAKDTPAPTWKARLSIRYWRSRRELRKRYLDEVERLIEYAHGALKEEHGKTQA